MHWAIEFVCLPGVSSNCLVWRHTNDDWKRSIISFSGTISICMDQCTANLLLFQNATKEIKSSVIPNHFGFSTQTWNLAAIYNACFFCPHVNYRLQEAYLHCLCIIHACCKYYASIFLFPARKYDSGEYLNITGITRDQAGDYECSALNDIASPDTKTVKVTVNCKYSSFFMPHFPCFFLTLALQTHERWRWSSLRLVSCPSHAPHESTILEVLKSKKR